MNPLPQGFKLDQQIAPPQGFTLDAEGSNLPPFDIALPEGANPEAEAKKIVDSGNIKPPEGFIIDDPIGKPSPAGVGILPSMPEKAPAITPKPMEQVKVYGMIDSLPGPVSEEVKKAAIEKQREKEYGVIKAAPAFTLSNAIENIPQNMEDIVKETGSLLMNIGRFAKNALVNHEEMNKQMQPAVELTGAIIKDWQSMFKGEAPKEISKLPIGFALDKEFEKIARQGIWQTLGQFAERRPIDALLITQAAKTAIGGGVRVTAQGLNKAIPKGTRIGDKLDSFLSTDRAPIVFEMPAETQVLKTPEEIAAGKQASKINKVKDVLDNEQGKVAVKLPDDLEVKKPDIKLAEKPEAAQGGATLSPDETGIIPDAARPRKTVSEPVKTVEFPREYSTDPLTKYIYQKSFDKILDVFPSAKKALAEHKANTLIDKLRRTYDQGNFTQRQKLIDEAMNEINMLSKEEQAIIIPYLEGRASIIGDTSEQFKNFETWYRGLSDTIQNDLSAMGKLTPEQIRERLYQPLTKATGKTVDEITAELGNFTPAYVHHTFPQTFSQKMGDFFADTTAKRYTPGFLKRSHGVAGYTEDFNEILPKWIAQYVKLKNTEGFLNDFTGKFGIPANIKDIKEVAGGLQVGDKTYRGYKVIAPDGILNFYRGNVDFYKEVSKRLEAMDFDEAIADAVKASFEGQGKDFMGVSKNRKVYLVPDNVAKRLESYATPLFGSQRIQNAVKLVYDKPTQIWKDFTLAAAPRWIKNNVIGDIVFNTIEGVGPLSYTRSFRAKYHDIIPDELLKASFANTVKYNPKLGLAAQSTVGKLAEAIGETTPVKLASKAKDIGYALNTMFEQPFVRSLYVKLARDKAVADLKAAKMPVTEENIFAKLNEFKNNPAMREPIIAKVEKTLPVFDMAGNFERKYIKRIMPFYNWYKFMAQYAVNLPATHPFKSVGARGLGALSEGQREQAFIEMFPYMKREIEASGVPDRFDNLWPVKMGDDGKAAFFNARGFNIFTTVEDLLKGDFLNMMSPLIKIPMERASGRETFSNREYKTGEAGLDFHGKEKQVPPLGEHILNQFQQHQLLKQTLVPARQYDTGTIMNPEPILDKITGEYKYPIDSVEKWLNYAGIDKRTLDVRKAFDAYKKQKAVAIGETFNKYQSKADTALSLDDIKGIFDNLKKDKVKWNELINELRDNAQQVANDKKEKAKLIKGLK
jgi:hypothetical protein